MDAATTPDRDQAMLAELAELDMALARKLQACAMAAEEPQVLADLARTYQRVARSLRQTLALKARLHRQARDMARDFPPPAPPRDSAHLLKRCDEVGAAVRRIVFDEKEGEEADYLFELIDDRLRHWVRNDAVGHGDLDGDIATMCLDFGLSAQGAANWRNLPDPVFTDDDKDDEDDEGGEAPVLESAHDPGWRSSG